MANRTVGIRQGPFELRQFDRPSVELREFDIQACRIGAI